MVGGDDSSEVSHLDQAPYSEMDFVRMNFLRSGIRIYSSLCLHKKEVMAKNKCSLNTHIF